MISRINVLPHHVANQIAAGEVIERPASVVKELLENALDAQATSIQIDIGFGGLNHIIVHDNGMGIVSDDLPLAIAPHATSKLNTLDDLYMIGTMGFRGEALASIASVSRLTIQSRSMSELHATRLQLDERGLHVAPYARTVGTTVEIRDLFFNAPVRKKFLKSELLEFLAIETVVKRFALSEPAIALKLIHNGKQRLNLPSAQCESTRQARLKKLFGKSFLEQAMALNVSQGNMTLTGWVSHPNFGRSQQDKQWVYINKRMVKDKLLMHAIKIAYEPYIYPGRHSVYLLYFNIASGHVDVNVHPTKHEVRFSNPREVHDFIYSSISEVIHQLPAQQEPRPISSGSIKNAYTQSYVSLRSSSWKILNKRYAILSFEEESYLVDIVRMRQNSLLLHMKSLELPWPTRPLLVPVTLQLEHVNQLHAEYQPILLSLGFIFEILDQNQIKIKIVSIPLDLPMLDVRYLMQHLNEVSPTQQELTHLLLKSDGWDLTMITAEEEESWMSFWLDAMKSKQGMPYSVLLNENQCEAFFCE
jgi:DNA mismatch repair protein MutL